MVKQGYYSRTSVLKQISRAVYQVALFIIFYRGCPGALYVTAHHPGTAARGDRPGHGSTRAGHTAGGSSSSSIREGGRQHGSCVDGRVDCDGARRDDHQDKIKRGEGKIAANCDRGGERCGKGTLSRALTKYTYTQYT